MAYTVKMTNENITRNTNGTYSVSIRAQVFDDIPELVIDIIINSVYDPRSSDLDGLKLEILDKLKEQWDAFISAGSIGSSQIMEDALADMTTSAENYINS